MFFTEEGSRPTQRRKFQGQEQVLSVCLISKLFPQKTRSFFQDTRMIMRLAGKDVIDRCENLMKEDSVFFVKNFLLNFEVEDRLMKRISVSLVGDSALEGWCDYNWVKRMVNQVEIVQFGAVKKEGDEVSLGGVTPLQLEFSGTLHSMRLSWSGKSSWQGLAGVKCHYSPFCLSSYCS
ncbi:hypothetical protein K1719_014596 [Acacia pycnantha]|nr:hypothetical protein K1719_014596 [Acacia pycnantha]